MTSITKLNSSDTRVISHYEHCVNYVKSKPSAYLPDNKSFNLSLKTTLIEYANKSAGNHGVTSNFAPVGIRVKCDDSASLRDSVLSSIESFTNFLNSSECNAKEYCDRLREIHASGKSSKSKASKVKVDTRMAKDAIYAIHGDVKGFKILKSIQSAYFNTKERAAVMTKLFNETPLCEIELTYGNPSDNYSLSAYAE